MLRSLPVRRPVEKLAAVVAGLNFRFSQFPPHSSGQSIAPSPELSGTYQ